MLLRICSVSLSPSQAAGFHTKEATGTCVNDPHAQYVLKFMQFCYIRSLVLRNPIPFTFSIKQKSQILHLFRSSHQLYSHVYPQRF